MPGHVDSDIRPSPSATSPALLPGTRPRAQIDRTDPTLPVRQLTFLPSEPDPIALLSDRLANLTVRLDAVDSLGGSRDAIAALRLQVAELVHPRAEASSSSAPTQVPPPAPPDRDIHGLLGELADMFRTQAQVSHVGIVKLIENLGRTQDALRSLARQAPSQPVAAQAPGQPVPAPSGPSCPHPINPGLPFYSGSSDPGPWLHQIDDLFRAYRTPPEQQLLWARCALQKGARDFVVQEYPNLTDMGQLAAVLKKRFRPITSQYQNASAFAACRMDGSDFQSYLWRFQQLRSQLRPQSQDPAVLQAVLHQFIRGLTPDFEQEVLYAQPKTLSEAVERALLYAQTRRTDLRHANVAVTDPVSSAPPTSAAAAHAGRHMRDFSRGRGPQRLSTGPENRRSVSAPRFARPPRDSSARPGTPGQSSPAVCQWCNRPGHTARTCWNGPGAAQAPQSFSRGAPSPRGRGRGRGRGRPPPGNGGR